MPQIQILPYQQTPLEQLMPHVEQALGDISTGFGKYQTNKKDQAILEGMKNAQSPMEFLSSYMQLSPERQKSSAPVMAQQIRANTAALKEGKGLSGEEYSTIIDDLEKQLESGSAGMQAFVKSYLPGEMGAEAREGTAKFQSQSTALLGLAQKIALKQGIRNQREFQTFLDRTVPNASDTVETAKGKLEALRSYIHEEGKASLPKKAPSERPPLEGFYR